MTRRRTGVVARRVDDQVVALDLASSQYYSVNATGAVLWDLLEADVGRDDMIDVLVDRFGVDRARAGADVDAFVTELRSHGLLAE